jgi:hypothetical protein
MPIIAGRASAAYGAGFSRVVTAAYAGPFGAYDSIATTTVGASGASSVTFANIPSTYKHLQIRATSKMSSGASLFMQLNSDAGSNYARHFVNGSGSSVGVGGNANFTNMFAGTTANATSTFGVSIIDILDYTTTNKYTTTRSFSGADANGSGFVQFMSGLWLNTAAVTTITITGESNFQEYTSFALYGVK